MVAVKVGGKALGPNATYKVATNDFMLRGGDGYTAFGKGKELINPIDATLMASQVIDYIAAKGTIAPAPEGRIVIE